MFSTLLPELIFHDVNQLKPPIPHGFPSLPVPFLASRDSSRCFNTEGGALAGPALPASPASTSLLTLMSWLWPTGLDFALLILPQSFCSCGTQGRKFPLYYLTLPYPSDPRRAFPKSLSGSSYLLSLLLIVSPTLLDAPKGQRRRLALVISVSLGPTMAWHIRFNKYLLTE